MNKNHNSILILPNNLYSLLATQAYTDEITRKAGLGATDRARICLALEEAMLNVASHSFKPREMSMYQIIFRVTDSAFTIIVCDNGLPFEEPVFPVESMMTGDIDTYPKSGLGLHIMRNCVDEVIVKNSPAGKELHLVKYLNHPEGDQRASQRSSAGIE